MMSNMSLKYRIAAIIFLLEGIMMAFVLSVTLNDYFASNRKVAAVNEQVLLNVLGDLSRIALFTAEYDELQPYIEEVVAAPGVERIVVLNNRDRIVVSSEVTDVGKIAPQFHDDTNRFWKINTISNSAGELGKLAINFSHDALVAANKRATDLGVSTALAGMITIAVIGVLIGYFLTRRLSTLKVAAQKIADGDLSVKADVHGNDEVSILAQAFNQMSYNVKKYVDDLHNSQRELRMAHDNLEQRILDRTAELAVARDQAMQANRTKSVFLANMSHELRTPLNAIIGYAEMLIEEYNDEQDSQLSDDLRKIKDSGKHLLSLINDVLDISKIEAGKVEFNLTEFNIASLIEEVLTNIEPLLQSNNNHLNVIYPKDIGFMFADQTKLRQILINLIGNAVKFTTNGEITFEAKKEKLDNKTQVIFRVKDTGIGIGEDHIGKLFEEFSQVDPSSTRKYGGTGLGLAISKRNCEIMGGDISVKSASGKGSTFTVTLPAAVVIKEKTNFIPKPNSIAVDYHASQSKVS